MLLQLASAARWLGPEGCRIFAACRYLNERRLPQPGLQYLIIDHYGWEAIYFDQYADRDGRCRRLYRAFEHALWETIRSDFRPASCCLAMQMLFTDGTSRIIALNVNGISTTWPLASGGAVERFGLRYAVGGFQGCFMTIIVLTPQKYKRRRDSYIMRVGGNDFDLKLVEKTIDSIGQGFWYQLEFVVGLGRQQIEAGVLPGLPGGPHYGELLG